MYKYSCRFINIISPNRFQRVNKDFAIFVFVVKNILEHIGALEHNIKPTKEFVLYNARLKYNKEILEILNEYLHNSKHVFVGKVFTIKKFMNYMKRNQL